MILIPNLGGLNLARDHFGFLAKVPTEADIDSVVTPGLTRKYATVDGAYDFVPQAVLNGVLASEWTLDVSLNCGAATLSVVAQTLKYDGGALSDAESIGDKAYGKGSHVITYNGSATSGSSDVSLSLEIGSMSLVRWEWTDELWTLPIYADLNADDGTNAGAWAVGWETNPGTFGTASGVTFTFCGETVSLYDVGSSVATVTGSISLVPSKWLTVNPIAVP